MNYRFIAYGHPNILGTHKTAIEFTKDKDVSLRGNCIVGVKADFDLGELKEFIKKIRNKSIVISIQPASKSANFVTIAPKPSLRGLLTNVRKPSLRGIGDKICAEVNSDFNSDKEIVIRKSSFISERTFAIKSNKASSELKRDLISFLKNNGSKMMIVIESA